MLDAAQDPAHSIPVGAGGEGPTGNPANLPAPENRRYFPALDGLRAIAVLMVFFEHYLTKYGWMHWGWAGVDLFFVLSGFLITGILYDTRHAARRFSTFYMRRTLRIFPLYYGVLLLLVLLNPILHWKWQPALPLYPLYLTNYARFAYYHAFIASGGFTERLLSTLPFQKPFYLLLGHFWTLSLEEQFYLAWPLVVFGVSDRKRLVKLSAFICVAVFFGRVACAFLIPARFLQIGFLYYVAPCRVDALVLGGLIALMLRGQERAVLLRVARIAIVVLITIFFAFQIGYFLSHRVVYEVDVDSRPMATYGFLLIDLFAAALILYCLDPGTMLYRILTLSPLRWLGSISYGFYILHDIPHMIYVAVIFRLLPHTPFIQTEIALLAFCSTTLLAWLSFRFFETPFLRLKSRFTVH